jgi:hypothetical protein
MIAVVRQRPVWEKLWHSNEIDEFEVAVIFRRCHQIATIGKIETFEFLIAKWRCRRRLGDAIDEHSAAIFWRA